MGAVKVYFEYIAQHLGEASNPDSSSFSNIPELASFIIDRVSDTGDYIKIAFGNPITESEYAWLVACLKPANLNVIHRATAGRALLITKTNPD